ncbi:MAG TPA: hypothetical protein PK280_09270, partial [Planctomycetota bacterium]|nr:hypothetical protein [Planctomycetota bacterium]
LFEHFLGLEGRRQSYAKLRAGLEKLKLVAEGGESAYAAACPELARTGAAATWSMADVGRTVLDRIEERRRKSGLPTVRITLPMKLREPGV